MRENLNDRRETDEHIDHLEKPGPCAEKRLNEIVIGNADKPPVETPDHEENKRDDMNCFHITRR